MESPISFICHFRRIWVYLFIRNIAKEYVNNNFLHSSESTQAKYINISCVDSSEHEDLSTYFILIPNQLIVTL
jgi:hypothetical protein